MIWKKNKERTVLKKEAQPPEALLAPEQDEVEETEPSPSEPSPSKAPESNLKNEGPAAVDE